MCGCICSIVLCIFGTVVCRRWFARNGLSIHFSAEPDPRPSASPVHTSNSANILLPLALGIGRSVRHSAEPKPSRSNCRAKRQEHNKPTSERLFTSRRNSFAHKRLRLLSRKWARGRTQGHSASVFENVAWQKLHSPRIDPPGEGKAWWQPRRRGSGSKLWLPRSVPPRLTRPTVENHLPE